MIPSSIIETLSPAFNPDPLAVYRSHHIPGIAEEPGIPSAFELDIPTNREFIDITGGEIEADSILWNVIEIHQKFSAITGQKPGRSALLFPCQLAPVEGAADWFPALTAA